MKYLFLDTNIFLHYQMYDQIPWKDYLGKAEITIILPPVLIRELNSHKDLNTNKRISNRSGKVLMKIAKDLERSGQNEVEVQQIVLFLEDRDPVIDFGKYQLKHEINDDHFIASMIFFKSEHPSDEVYLVTNDYALHLIGKARRQHFEVLKLNESLKIKEKTESVKSGNRPKLEIVFRDGGKTRNFILGELEDNDLNLKYKEIEEIRKSYPQKRQCQNNNDSQIANIVATVNAFYIIPDEEYERYNTELAGFYESYQHYIKECKFFDLFIKRKLEFSLIIQNKGGLPAFDVDVMLHFPNGFKMINLDERPKSPIAPSPPARPRSKTESMLLNMDNMNSLTRSALPFIQSNYLDATDSFSNRPQIEETNSYNVSYSTEKIKHHMSEEIEAMILFFTPNDEIRSFHVDYEIVADNVPEKVTGQLNFVVTENGAI